MHPIGVLVISAIIIIVIILEGTAIIAAIDAASRQE